MFNEISYRNWNKEILLIVILQIFAIAYLFSQNKVACNADIHRPIAFTFNIGNDDELKIVKEYDFLNDHTIYLNNIWQGQVHEGESVIINPNGDQTGTLIVDGLIKLIDIIGSVNSFAISAWPQVQSTTLDGSRIQLWVNYFDLRTPELEITDKSRLYLYDNDPTRMSRIKNDFRNGNNPQLFSVLRNSYVNIQSKAHLDITNHFMQVGEIGEEYTDGAYWNPFDYSVLFFSAPNISIDAGGMSRTYRTRFFRGSRSFLGFNAASNGTVDADLNDCRLCPDPPDPFDPKFLIISEGMEFRRHGKDGEMCNVQFSTTGQSYGWGFSTGIEVGLDGLSISVDDVIGNFEAAGSIKIESVGVRSRDLFEDKDNDCYEENKIKKDPYPISLFEEVSKFYSCDNLPGWHHDENDFDCDVEDNVDDYNDLCGITNSGCNGNSRVMKKRQDTENEILINPFDDLYPSNSALKFYKILPNPSIGGRVKLMFSLRKSQDIRIIITDMNGRIIDDHNYGPVVADESKIYEPNVFKTDLKSGIYLVSISGQDFNQTKKLILQ